MKWLKAALGILFGLFLAFALVVGSAMLLAAVHWTFDTVFLVAALVVGCGALVQRLRSH